MNQKQKCNHCGESGIPFIQMIDYQFHGLFSGQSNWRQMPVCRYCGSPDLEPTLVQISWNTQVKRQAKIEKIIGWILVIFFSGLVLAGFISANL